MFMMFHMSRERAKWLALGFAVLLALGLLVERLA